MDGNTELLSISAFARRVGLAPSALRFYDDCRVLRPAHVDGASGYRFYRPDQEPRARLVRSLREAGLPLADVVAVIEGSGDDARAVLERHRGRVRARSQEADVTIAAVLRTLSETAAPTRVRLGGAELASAARQVAPAVGRDAAHPELACVLVEIDDAEVRLVATDRYRFSTRVLTPAASDGPPCHFLIDAADLIEAGAWAARCAEVTIEIGPDGGRESGGRESGGRESGGRESGGRLYGTAGSRALPLAGGRFPAYRDVLSALPPPECRVIVDRAALLAAVHRCGDTPAITVRLGEDEVVVSRSADPGPRGGSAVPAVRQEDLPLTIAFDPAVLAPALETGVGPDVLLEISTPTQPVVVRSADQGSFTTLVMPVALATPTTTTTT
ncbi:DNA polymerase III subunit beta family protein [Streptomyces liangshanensis]|uniref:DNA polymerase III subunit beta family protein n=1 Tax=Streptomyces liangshanensis TaxID=2717324 RepID=UPI0036D8D9DB